MKDFQTQAYGQNSQSKSLTHDQSALVKRDYLRIMRIFLYGNETYNYAGFHTTMVSK